MTRGEEMEEYIKYARNNQPALILVLISLCLILMVGVTYDTVLLNQIKIQATQANNNAQAADNDARAADSDVQKTDQDVTNVCNSVNNLPC